MSLKLTYFDMPGRAQPIRILFHIGGIVFEDERLSREEFAKQKQAGVFKYGQIPVLEINGQQFAQSGALLRFAASKAGLLPTDSLDLLKAEQLSGNINEIISQIIPTFALQGEEQKKARQELATTVIPKWLGYMNKDLEKNGSNGFVAGNKLSFADIQLFNQVRFLSSGMIDHVPTDIVKNYPNIIKVYEQVLANPKVQEYLSLNISQK